MFNHENIQCIDTVKDYKEAIRISSKPLIKKGKINNLYVEKIIENVDKLGFYIVIDDFVAMPHARPEDGVNETSISFLKVNSGINFGDNKIYLIFTLASKNSDEHIEILKKIMEILQNEKIKKKLLEAKNIEQIYKILK
ncbi:PTS sugar transporter subunit IIA [Oceanivirga salmonicida]|uniref:PTS sugar transporter subunit IIA n=1 Tax=Oceanivirga salmonicida TaxID=1769291 RepID=UPI000831849A|nr:PTS sugar transporter subunit IIA [Oceanivirga salmonicida]